MKRVLLTPLDWGLGHATRCVPIIRELQVQGWEVLVAGSGAALELLRIEFPALQFFSLPAYAPRYPLRGSMVLSIAQQLPRFIRVIGEEHKTVEEIVRKEGIDLIISDNRYGCWSRKVPSVFLTHQHNIIMPKRLGFLRFVVRKLSDRLIQRFQLCWIPDLPGDHSLAGELSSFENAARKHRLKYIGALSRFRKERGAVQDFRFDVLAVFSGPEPQRTALENIVVPQLQQSGLNYRVVRGLPGSHGTEDSRMVNFLPSKELQNLIESSAVIISRSGYSTVMDMQVLGKKVIFIPTPGQTEQEYLAKSLMEKGIAFSTTQKEFDLRTAIIKSRNFSGFTPADPGKLLSDAITRLTTFVKFPFDRE